MADLPDMRKKENRYNPELIMALSELDKAQEDFVRVAQEAGVINQELSGQNYETLMTQNQLPDMRLKPNRHNPKLVIAYGQIVMAKERINQKALEIKSGKSQEKKDEPEQIPTEQLKSAFEEHRPPEKKKRGS